MRHGNKNQPENPFEGGDSTPYAPDSSGVSPVSTRPLNDASSEADPYASQSTTPTFDRHTKFSEPAEPEEDGRLSRKDTSMKRNRWGTQLHRGGRPGRKSKGKSKGSILPLHESRHGGPPGSNGPPNGGDHHHDHADTDSHDGDGPPTQANREIYVNLPLPEDLLDPQTGLPKQVFCRNKIRTTKYTPLSFLPKNIWYQFHNIANIYFLFIVILGAFPIFGVQNPGLAAVPIVVIVIVTAVKDAIEDYRRTVLDLEVNNTATEVLADAYNPNVVDENVSYWRRFKKANSRLILRMNLWFKNKRADHKEKKTGVRPEVKNIKASLENADVYSVYSRNSVDLQEIDNPFAGGSSEPTLTEQDQQPSFDPADSVINPAIKPKPNAHFKRDFWKNVRVGDFIRIRNDQEIPADVVILSTSEDDGACYVETKNLDGETNLKIRQALRCGEGIRHSADCERAQFWMQVEPPQANLYSFNGVCRWETQEGGSVRSEPISINNLLLRGCTLRNTEWVIGVAVYTGMDTKIMMNAGVTPTKRSRLQRDLNIYVIYNFALLFILCFVSGLVNGIMHNHKNTSAKEFELGSIGGSPPVDGIVTFWASVILYQSLVPISLYISIEIVKTIQAFYIYSDCYMYYDKIDYPCTPKSWNISDDLGQIEYVFSDKTGTLTQNVMEFKKCTVNGVAYGKAYTEALAGLRKREGVDVEEEARRMEVEIANDKVKMIANLRKINDNKQMVDNDVTFISSQFVDDLQGSAGAAQADACHHFMLCLALCHSVITEESKKIPGRKDFKAQSPDEAALVAAARDMGFTLVGRTHRGVIVNIQGEEIEYQILNTLEFNSTRKRMSAIVKIRSSEHERERILLICKGADSIIYERLAPNAQRELREKTAVQLEEFANEGLRTLCIAERELTPEEYYAWNERHEKAAAEIADREAKLDEVAELIERDMTLLGGTAIEDRLQDGVPSTISLLGDGGIKLWVLTGDKVETAINIGFSCNLLDNSMELLVIKVENGDKGSVPALIDEYLHRHFRMDGSFDELEAAKNDHSSPSPRFAVVIDGDALKLALNPAVSHKFLLLCKQCKSVLCCRVSPAQKAAVVRLVRTTLDVMTLSIGDGANDVAMIQEADVGVGIAGEEGRQAVMSSDYAIGQFRFLSRLMLVHGGWSYKRLAEMIPNFFYKNIVFTFTLFWYGVFDDFDGSYLYDYTYVMFFNLAFTSLPIIFMGILDQAVPDKIALAVPQLYRRGILRADFTQVKFWLYMFEGIFQSAVSFFFPYLLYYNGRFDNMSGRSLDHRFWMGLAACTISVACCNLFVLSNQYRWDIISVIVNVVSTLLVFVWSGIYSSFPASSELYKVAAEMYGALSFWAVCLLGIVAAMLPHFTILTSRALWKPLDVDIIREQWRLGEFDEIMATQLASDDPEAAPYNNPYRPSTHRPRTNAARRAAARLARLTRATTGKRQPDPTYELPNESHSNIARSPDVVRFGDNPIRAEHYTFDHQDTALRSQTETPDYVRYGNEDVPVEQFTFDDAPTLRDHARDRASNELRQSLDLARRNSRWEQRPVNDGIENIRTSLDIDDLTTAEGLVGRHLDGGKRPRKSP